MTKKNVMKWVGYFYFSLLGIVSVIPNVFADGENSNTCDYILGSLSDPDSFASILKEVFNLIQFVGPVLVIVLTVWELLQAVLQGKKDSLNKMAQKTIKRVVFAVLLFLIPFILNFVFKFVGVWGVCNVGM